MNDLTPLLERHKPKLRYDSHEVYFADSAAEWTDNPGHALRRGPQGAVLAEAPDSPPTPPLSLAYLGPASYPNDGPVSAEDLISCPYRDYTEQARNLHVQPGYANRVYGRWAQGTDGCMWLQYWFFYFYNDFELLGDAFPAGLHEGDWEMIQLRLDAEEASPDLAVYAKHKSAEARRWKDVELLDDLRPIVYVARGSHAAYFKAGTQWGEAWFDHADGKGFSPELELEVAHDDDPAYAWMRWPGFWGDTKPNPEHILRLLDDSSPRGPGGHGQWKDPHSLLRAVDDYEQFERAPGAGAPAPPPAPAPPAAAPPPAPELEPTAPNVTLARSGQQQLRVAYDSPQWPAALQPVRLLVTVNSPQDPKPPVAYSVPISAPHGAVDVPVELRPDWSYEVHVSVAGVLIAGGVPGAPPLTSPATTEPLPPA